MSRRRADRPLEASVEQTFRRAAAAHDCIAKKLGQDGWPDRMLLGPAGQVAFCELKRPGEKPEPLQVYVMHQLRERGFFVEVVDSSEDVPGFFVRWLNRP